MLHQFFTFVQLCDTQLTIFFLAFSYTLSTPTFARSTVMGAAGVEVGGGIEGGLGG